MTHDEIEEYTLNIKNLMFFGTPINHVHLEFLEVSPEIISQLLEQTKIMKEALEFYSKKHTYEKQLGYYKEINRDLGNLAKKALKKYRKLEHNYDFIINEIRNKEDDLPMQNQVELLTQWLVYWLDSNKQSKDWEDAELLAKALIKQFSLDVSSLQAEDEE